MRNGYTNDTHEWVCNWCNKRNNIEKHYNFYEFSLHLRVIKVQYTQHNTVSFTLTRRVVYNATRLSYNINTKKVRKTQRVFKHTCLQKVVYEYRLYIYKYLNVCTLHTVYTVLYECMNRTFWIDVKHKRIICFNVRREW